MAMVLSLTHPRTPYTSKIPTVTQSPNFSRAYLFVRRFDIDVWSQQTLNKRNHRPSVERRTVNREPTPFPKFDVYRNVTAIWRYATALAKYA